MTDEDLSSVLRASGLSLDRGAGRIRVQLELRSPTLDAASREQLESCGLEIDQAIGNKVFGSIESRNRCELQRLDAVAGVEDAVKLKPHPQRGG